MTASAPIKLAIAAALSCACGGSAAESAAPAAPARAESDTSAAVTVDADLVRFYLLSDVSRVAPGQELTLAVRFDIEPTWHIYWKNPGDSGLATEVELSAPDGFEVGELRYPGPARFDDPGGVVSFGYEELVMLSAPVVAPDALPGEPLVFRAEASWLVCRESCVRGSGTAEVTLEVAGPGHPSAPMYQELLARHRRELPRPLGELESAAVEWNATSSEMIIRVPGASQLDYFPAVDEQTRVSGQMVVPARDGAELRVSYKSGDEGHGEGVLAVTSDGETSYYKVR